MGTNFIEEFEFLNSKTQKLIKLKNLLYNGRPRQRLAGRAAKHTE